MMAITKFIYLFSIMLSRVECILPPNYEVTAPFMAYVDIGDSFFCGGVIINQQVVLTAGHCILPSSSIIVTVGRSSINNSTQTVVVQKSLTHEHFVKDPNGNGIQAYNDIALLLLKHPLDFNLDVQPIQISNRIDFLKNVTVIGAGSTDAFEKSIPQHLLAKNISIIPENMCVEMLDEAIGKCTKQIYEFCIEKSSCYGDSGGPITQTIGNVTKLVGIVSWGADDNINCDTAPHIAVNVVYFSEWIHDGSRSLLSEKVSENTGHGHGDQENVVD